MGVAKMYGFAFFLCYKNRLGYQNETLNNVFTSFLKGKIAQILAHFLYKSTRVYIEQNALSFY